MTTATFGRDPFMPSPPQGRGPALALALLAHALLIAALAFGVHWRNSEPTTMAAELWSAVPQAAAPRAVAPPPGAAPQAVAPPPSPQPPAVAKPEPVARPAATLAPPKTEAAPLPDPQIAIEQTRRATAKREQAEQERQAQQAKRMKAEREAAQREVAEREAAEQETAKQEKQRVKQREIEVQRQRRADADKLRAETAKNEKARTEKANAEQAKADRAKTEQADKADAARLAAAREANLKRMLGQAGATGGATDTGSAARSSGPSASYAGRIMARIKPNIVFSDTPDGNPMATVEVRLAPDGTIVAKRLVKSSGVKSWDDAVLRAIERTEVLPRDIDGRVPPPFQIDFRLRD